jgi:Na+/phosphate symporter
MSQKIEIRKDKIELPINDNIDKIHYSSNLSDKRFQNKLFYINENLDKISGKIKEFIELLSKESRKNDEYISEKIYESLQEIFKVAKNNIEIDSNKLKQNIIK